MSKPVSGKLRPDSPNSKENSKPMLTPDHTLRTETVPMQPFVDADLHELGIDSRWIAANARYRRAKTFNRADVYAAVLECQRVVAMMAKEAKEPDAMQKPVQPKTNDGFQPSHDGKSEGSWCPESMYSNPEEFKEQEGNNLEDQDVDPRSTIFYIQRWLAGLTGNPGDLDSAELERKRFVAMIDTEANAVAEPFEIETDRLRLSSGERSETSQRPESLHASPAEFEKHEEFRLKYQAFKRLLQVLIDSHIGPLIRDPKFWKTQLRDCTAEQCEELYLAFSDLFLYSTSDKKKWYVLLSDDTSARSGNLLRFICERVRQGIVVSHDENAEDSGRTRMSSIGSKDSGIVRESNNAGDYRPYSYGCGARGTAFGTEDDATESEDSEELGGVKLPTQSELLDEDRYDASCSESDLEVASPLSPTRLSPTRSSGPLALCPVQNDAPIEAQRRSSFPARLREPNNTRFFQAQQEHDDFLRGRFTLRYSPDNPLALLRLVGPLKTAVEGLQPRNKAWKADERTVTFEEPKDLSEDHAEDENGTAGVRVMFEEEADENTVTSEEPKDLSEPDAEDDADDAGV